MGFIEKLGELFETHERTVNAHYGVNDKEFQKMADEILSMMVLMDKRTDVIDKAFPLLDNVGRAKVFAYAEASEKYRRLQK